MNQQKSLPLALARSRGARKRAAKAKLKDRQIAGVQTPALQLIEQIGAASNKRMGRQRPAKAKPPKVQKFQHVAAPLVDPPTAHAEKLQ